MQNGSVKEAYLKSEERVSRLLDLSLKITDDFTSARRLDIGQLRSLIFQISTLSLAVVGFSIPIIGTQNIVKTTPLFIAGLLILTVAAIFGLFYAAIIIENSLIGSVEGYKRNKKEVRTQLENEYFRLQNPDKEDEYIRRTQAFVEQLKDSSDFAIKRDKVLYILLTMFSIGLILIFLSLFRIQITI